MKNNKEIKISINIELTIQESFNLFINNNKVENWLCQSSDIEPKKNGKYHLFWDKRNRKHLNTIGCKITEIDYPNFITFEWKSFKFAEIMNLPNSLTKIEVSFTAIEKKITEIELIHKGWQSTDKWNQAKQWYRIAWESAFISLEDYVKNILLKKR